MTGTEFLIDHFVLNEFRGLEFCRTKLNATCEVDSRLKLCSFVLEQVQLIEAVPVISRPTFTREFNTHNSDAVAETLQEGILSPRDPEGKPISSASVASGKPVVAVRQSKLHSDVKT